MVCRQEKLSPRPTSTALLELDGQIAPVKDVIYDEGPLLTSERECCLLEVLLTTVDLTMLEKKAIETPDLLKEVWGEDNEDNKKALSVDLYGLRQKLKVRGVFVGNLKTSSRQPRRYYLGLENEKDMSLGKMVAAYKNLQGLIEASQRVIEKNEKFKNVTLPNGQKIADLTVGEGKMLAIFIKSYCERTPIDKNVLATELGTDNFSGTLSNLRKKVGDEGWEIIGILPREKERFFAYWLQQKEKTGNTQSSHGLILTLEKLIPPEVKTKIEIDGALAILSHLASDWLSELDKDPLKLFKNCLPPSLDYKNQGNLPWFITESKSEEAIRKRERLQELKKLCESQSEEAIEKRKESGEWATDCFMATIRYYWNIRNEGNNNYLQNEKKIISFCRHLAGKGMTLDEAEKAIKRHFFSDGPKRELRKKILPHHHSLGF